ncbi:hypothetical protein ABIC83_002503 [Roseateles asaccharophilus]|uniref:ADP-ribosyltransferase-containing protein n=1 Tax=Roseateles asaccharophilus TaxID=582607 RepID=UPI003835946C
MTSTNVNRRAWCPTELTDTLAPNGRSVAENFNAWFRASRVADANGRPKVVFHGTASDFGVFDPALSGTKSKTGAPQGSFFFTDSPEVASSYTVKWQGDFSSELHPDGNVMPVYLRIERPLKVNANGDSWREIRFRGEDLDINDIVRLAKASGRYDGIVVTKVCDKGVGSVSTKLSTTYVAFDAAQIKSAIGNSGNFALNVACIRDAAAPNSTLETAPGQMPRRCDRRHIRQRAP